MSTAESAPIEEIRLALTTFIQTMCDDPHAVSVHAEPSSTGTLFRVSIADDDLGHIVGKQGRTAQALRLILLAASGRYKTRFSLEIDKPANRS